MVDKGGILVKQEEDRLEMLSPPRFFSPVSYELMNIKRTRAGSISQRLRSVSDLEERGIIDKSQKGVLKDLIISGDELLQGALDTYEGGDSGPLSVLLKQGTLDRKDSLDFLKDLEMGLLSVGMSSTCGESDQEFPGSFDKDSLRNMTSTSFPPPMPVLLPKLRAEYSPQVKQCSTYAPNQFSLSDMTFDATFNHDYNPQAPIVTVKSGKEMDCIDPVGVSVGPLQAARGHSDSISVVEQAIEACRAEIDAAAAEGQQPPYFDIMGSLTSELPLQFPFSDEIALELGDGLGSLLAQCEQSAVNAANVPKAKGSSGVKTQQMISNSIAGISIPKLPLRKSGDKRFVGAYSPESRMKRIERFIDKRKRRVWTKIVKYDVRKNFADTRMRVKGRFVKKDDEALLREVMALA